MGWGPWWWQVAAWVGLLCIASFTVFGAWAVTLTVLDRIRWNRRTVRMSKEWARAHRPQADDARGYSDHRWE